MSREDIRKFLLILIAGFLPWNTIIGNVFLIIAVLISIYSLFKDEVLLKNIFTLKYFSATSLIFVYIIGIFYSSNINYAISFVQTTISLLFFPLIFMNISFVKKDFKNMALSFVLSYSLKVLTILIYFVYGLRVKGYNKNWYFQKIEDIAGIHPTYLSLFSILSILLILYLLSVKKRKWMYILAFFHFLVLFALAVRITIFAFFVLIIVYSVYLIKIKKTNNKIVISVFLVIITLVLALFANNSDLKYKFAQLKNFKGIKYNKYDASSVSTRIAKWESAISIFKENNTFIGTGTGDIPQDLMKQYYKLDCLDCKVNKYNNPHNQYLDALARNGLLGIIALVLVVFFPFYLSLKDKNIYFFLFSLIFLISLTTECLLNREKGIQMYGFFYWFFYRLKKRK